LDYASPSTPRVRRWNWLLHVPFVITLVVGGIYAWPRHRFQGCVITYEMKCLSNLSMIGKGILLYSNENGGRLPLDLMTMAAAEEMPASYLICPASPASDGPVTPAEISYTYLGAGRTMADVTPDEIIAYDSACMDDGIHVLFGDGRAERFFGKDAKDIKAVILRGRPPVRWTTP
jgi:hypothetical protein